MQVVELAKWILAILILAICYDVFMRYFFNKPTVWAYEFSYICGAIIASLGFGYLHILDGNIRVDVFYTKFSPKTKLLVDTVLGILIYLPTYFMITKSWILNTHKSFLSKEVSAVTTLYTIIWPLKAAITLSLIVFMIILVVDIIRKILSIVSMVSSNKKGVNESDAIS